MSLYRMSALVLASTFFSLSCTSAPEPVPASCIATKGSSAPAKPAALPVPAGNEIDSIAATCAAGPVVLPACPSAVTIDFQQSHAPAAHIDPPTPITYTEAPPTAGPHRSGWAKWGEFEYLPAQRWLHNLEHGGAALLYDPCADSQIIAQLRGFARCRQPDGGGQFRWVMTPYPGLGAAWSVVTWQWRIKGNCFDAAAVEAFLQQHYNKAEEDVASDGSWSYGWMGK